MKLRSKSVYLLVIMYIMLFLGGTVAPGSVFAASDTTSSTATETSESGSTYGGFSYNNILPENQRDTGVSYFDLRMEPGQQQTVQIELVNYATVPRTMLVSLNGAKSTSTGVIEYANPDIANDPSLKYDFKDIVTGPESIEMPASGSVMLELNIQMPESSYDGVISGGIQLRFQDDADGEGAQSAGVITNEYAYVIGMTLTETDTVVSPELALNSVAAGLSNYRNAVLVNLSNTEAAFLNDLVLDVQITTANSDQVLFDSKVSGMRMAPNSFMEFPVSMNGETMEAGDYRAIIVATAGDRSWNWEENFSITSEEADQFNQADVSLSAEEGINWLLVLLIAGGIIIVGLIIFVIIHALRKKKQQTSRDKGNSSKNKKKARK
ncbi:DUF916 and DUF3324 domain-containing protein [Enterococcus sp. HY326]|uniref:DUF916 and DUF3324 domain-containing protein n=1 Tax=Enterococcus sp. HY326 TaxID=2971265 RepID=UPI00223ED9A4|nr:DUF916 and DUF3324 domain-containing protein [Enterococcus sp. HY326]